MTVTASDVDKLVNAGSILRIFWTPQHSHPLPYLPSRPLPLEVDPLNPARGSGGAL